MESPEGEEEGIYIVTMIPSILQANKNMYLTKNNFQKLIQKEWCFDE